MVDVVAQLGSVAELHALDPFVDGPVAGPTLWWCRFDDAAVVLGSRQQPELIDAERARSAGLAVVGRRSGGGAVVLRPAETLWIDLVLPPDRAGLDVRRSMVLAGDCWRDALSALGAPDVAMTVHRGGMVDTPWSDLVCFAGVGPGEILVSGRKLLGLSQRRGRHGARLQGLVHRGEQVGSMAQLFAGPTPSAPLAPAAELDDVGLGDVSDDAVVAALADAVGERTAAR